MRRTAILGMGRMMPRKLTCESHDTLELVAVNNMADRHEHPLHHFTRRLVAGRDEYRRETYRRQGVCTNAAAVGADAIRDLFVGC